MRWWRSEHEAAVGVCVCHGPMGRGGGLGAAPADRALQRRSLVPPGPHRRLGGLRNTLAAKGVNLDVDLVQSLQGLNSGGLANDSVLYRYGGHAEYFLHVDTGKLGLQALSPENLR